MKIKMITEINITLIKDSIDLERFHNIYIKISWFKHFFSNSNVIATELVVIIIYWLLHKLKVITIQTILCAWKI